MNKILSICLAIVLMLSLAACQERGEAIDEGLSSSSQEVESSSSNSSEPSEKPESSQSEPEIQDAQLTEMYFDYFNQQSFVSMLFHDDGTNGFSEQSMGAYAVAYLIANNPEYDFEKGSTVEEFDAVTQKYFGKKLVKYENDLITLLPDNRIGSTGWGFSPTDLVLKDIKDNGNGTKTGTFYAIPIPMEAQEASVRKQALLSGDFYGNNLITVVELTFEEMKGEGGSMYLKLISSKNLGEAEKPYSVYGK